MVSLAMDPIQTLDGDYDYIIAGAGSAGCVVANRLSTDPSKRVLLLEAGGSDRNFWLKLPVGYFRTIYDQRFSRLFETEPSEGTGGRGIVWPRGRVIGGSSSINGLVFIRGQHADFDEWDRLGAEGWSYRDVLPFFKRYERFGGPEDQWHGGFGEFETSDLRNRNRACDAWIEAAQQFGLPFNADFNAETTLGVGRYQLGIGKHWRTSSAAAFLHPIRESRPNLTVVSSAHATRILFEGRRATGIEYLKEASVLTARAEREVVFCAGTLQSPQLLQLSGVGPAALLREHGVPVQVDAPDVGANLQDHYQARVIVKLREKRSLNDQVRSPTGLATMGAQWLFGQRGPLTVGAGQVGGMVRTAVARDARADVLFNVMPLSVDKPGDPLHRFSGFSASAAQCRPESRGTVSIRSADPLQPPRVVSNYLTAPHDIKVLVEGLKMLRDIYRQPAFRDLITDDEYLPGRSIDSDAALAEFGRNRGGTVFHPVGTCRMGQDDAAVLDPRLRVRGVERLRVIDASAMPTMTSANTNAAAILIGERGADLLRAGA